MYCSFCFFNSCSRGFPRCTVGAKWHIHRQIGGQNGQICLSWSNNAQKQPKHEKKQALQVWHALWPLYNHIGFCPDPANSAVCSASHTLAVVPPTQVWQWLGDRDIKLGLTPHRYLSFLYLCFLILCSSLLLFNIQEMVVNIVVTFYGLFWFLLFSFPPEDAKEKPSSRLGKVQD